MPTNKDKLLIAIHGYSGGSTYGDVGRHAERIKARADDPNLKILKYSYKDIIYKDKFNPTIDEIKKNAENHSTVIIVGFSLGAWASCILANRLKKEKLSNGSDFPNISLMILLDAIWLQKESPIITNEGWLNALMTELKEILQDVDVDSIDMSEKPKWQESMILKLNNLAAKLNHTYLSVTGGVSAINEFNYEAKSIFWDTKFSWLDWVIKHCEKFIGDLDEKLVDRKFLEESYHVPDLVRHILDNDQSFVQLIKNYHCDPTTKDITNVIVEAASGFDSSQIEVSTGKDKIVNIEIPLTHTTIDIPKDHYLDIYEILGLLNLSDYKIRSSHNSYTSKGWWRKKADPMITKKILDEHFRAIELDIRSRKVSLFRLLPFIGKREPVVQHDFWARKKPLKKFLEVIRDLHSSDLKGPLIISLNFKTNNIVNDTMERIKCYFKVSNLLLASEIEHISIEQNDGTSETIYKWPTMKELKNKIIIGVHKKYYKKLSESNKKLVHIDDAGYFLNLGYGMLYWEKFTKHHQARKSIWKSLNQNKLVRIFPKPHIDFHFNRIAHTGAHMIAVDKISREEIINNFDTETSIYQSFILGYLS